MPTPASTSLSAFEQGYVQGLLSLPHKSLSEMHKQGLLPYSLGHSAQLLAQDPLPYQYSWQERLKAAPEGGYLAVDLVTVAHQGQNIEGVGQVYSSSDKGIIWGHSFVSSALIWKDKEPLPLRLEPFPTADMATADYPLLTPTEGMLNIAGDVSLAGYQLKGVVVDAQFTSSLGLRSLNLLKAPFIGKCRITLKIHYQHELVSIRHLAERFPPGRAHYYKRFGWYAKRLKVYLPEVGEVDLVLVWKRQGYGYELFALISTVKAGLQEVLGAWKRRWELEKSHRLYKQNFGLGDCQCRRYAAQLKHADLVLEAFLLVRAEREKDPSLSWRRAQELVSAKLEKALLTEQTLMAA